MTRTSWQHLAFSSVLKALRGAIRPSRFQRRAPLRLRQRAWAPTIALAAEVLEVRQMLSSMAMNDSYSVVHDRTLTENAAAGVLANDFNFGGSMSAVLVAGPSHGTLTLNSDGSFTFVCATHFAGTDSFTYHNWDGSSYSNTATVSISITNNAPNAGNISQTIYKDSFNSATEGAPTLLSNSSDSDGDSLTASLVTGPAHGSVTVNANGTYVYTSTAGYLGPDSFVFGVSDGIATSNATANLTVTSAFGAQQNTPDDPFAGNIDQGPFSTNQLTGSALVDYNLGQGHTLIYSSVTADVKPVIIVDTTVGSTTPHRARYELHIQFGGGTHQGYLRRQFLRDLDLRHQRRQSQSAPHPCGPARTHDFVRIRCTWKFADCDGPTRQCHDECLQRPRRTDQHYRR